MLSRIEMEFCNFVIFQMATTFDANKIDKFKEAF